MENGKWKMETGSLKKDKCFFSFFSVDFGRFFGAEKHVTAQLGLARDPTGLTNGFPRLGLTLPLSPRHPPHNLESHGLANGKTSGREQVCEADKSLENRAKLD